MGKVNVTLMLFTFEGYSTLLGYFIVSTYHILNISSIMKLQTITDVAIKFISVQIVCIFSFADSLISTEYFKNALFNQR